MATCLLLNRDILPKIKDKLAQKVCVWKLTALMSHKKTVMTYVMAPNTAQTLFGLAESLQFPFGLEKLKIVSVRNHLNAYRNNA